MRREWTWREAGLAAVYLGLGMASVLLWTRIADLQRLPSWHLDMIGGHAPAPNQYRPLTPWLAEGLRYLLPGESVYTAYLLLRGLITGLTLFFFDRYLRVWFSSAAAAGGALCLAAIMPFTYWRVVQESDPVNLLVFVLGFWALARERDLLLIPLVLVGTLNRETTAMLPAVYLLARWRERPAGEVAWRTAAIAGAWALAYGALRLGYGEREYYCAVVMWSDNVKTLGPTVLVLLLFGAMWGLAFVGAKTGPTMLRRSLWLVPPYIALHYVVALAWEVRLFLPLAPVIIPLSWLVLFPETERAAAERGRSKRSR